MVAAMKNDRHVKYTPAKCLALWGAISFTMWAVGLSLAIQALQGWGTP